MYYGGETIQIVERNATRTEDWLTLALNGPQIPMISSAKGSKQGSELRWRGAVWRAQEGHDDAGRESGTATVTAKPKLKRPAMYKVLLLNDDYTPMEFVVLVLERFFGISHAQAFELMLTVHKKGLAVVGVFSHEIAETKVAQVMDFAQRHQHPLQCTMEKE